MDIKDLSGDTMVQLAVYVDAQTCHLKERIISQMKLDPSMNVKLLHDGLVLRHNDMLESAGFAAGESYELIGILQEH